MPPDRKDNRQNPRSQLDAEVEAARSGQANVANERLAELDRRDEETTTRREPGDAVRDANAVTAARAREQAASTDVPASGQQANGANVENPAGDPARVPNPAGTPGSIESDAVRMKRMELENALRIKGIDTALSVWREQTSRENALRDREMAFEEWRQRTAITERDRVARLAATSFKRSFHGTFSNGFLSSSWAGPKVNPYKTLLDRLDSQIGGNPYAAGPEGRKAPVAPDWLRPLLPNGTADQRRSLNPGVQAGVQGQQAQGGIPAVDLEDWGAVRNAVQPGGVAIRAVTPVGTPADTRTPLGTRTSVRLDNPGYLGVRRSSTIDNRTRTSERWFRRQQI